MSVKIISIYPKARSIERPYGPSRGQGRYFFNIAPGSVENPAILEVPDCYQKTYYGENIGYKFDLIPAGDVATDLVQAMAFFIAGTGEGHKPGFAILDPQVPLEEQIERLNEQQNEFFLYLYEQADRAYMNKDYIRITEDHREAAKMLGKEGAPWVEHDRIMPKEDCPICKARIPKGSFVCSHCGRQIRQIPAHLQFRETVEPESIGAVAGTAPSEPEVPVRAHSRR
jgi:hypothetical protein